MNFEGATGPQFIFNEISGFGPALGEVIGNGNDQIAPHLIASGRHDL
jgi:hypothetical protein